MALSSGKDKESLTRKERYQLIRELSGEFHLYELVAFFNVPKSSYLNWKAKHIADKDEYLKTRIKEIFTYHKGRYGYRRITAQLHSEGLIVNHKKVKRLMRELNLYPVTVKRRKYSSYKGEVGRTAPNRLKRRFDVKEPDKVWATDVTEFVTEEGKLYLSPIKDMCTGEIISYGISPSPNMSMVMKMLDTALLSHPDHKGLMIHSDQGFQYQHALFVNRLKENGIVQSMSRKGNCLDNSKMETFFSTLKREMYYGHEKEFKTREQLSAAIKEYIEYYNNERIQIKLGYLSPLLFREKIA
ncbi:MAG: IS3 family transposase [Spirochaetes bacterium]|uniref:IS3 family transposase n=1 Tax=Candidatus Ornithospirochaeta stercoravium TaxID=2840897 RepID=A0A9D9IBE5_9SPIO|nr:IS3 family transposase [Candidatus Ornithospirochaeta stercoravium]